MPFTVWHRERGRRGRGWWKGWSGGFTEKHNYGKNVCRTGVWRCAVPECECTGYIESGSGAQSLAVGWKYESNRKKVEKVDERAGCSAGLFQR